MNDFNRAAILLKEYDHKKWDNLPKTTKIKLVNDYLEFRNRLIVAAIMGNANELFRNEVDEAEKKYIKVDKKDSRNRKKTTKRIPETENSLKLSFVDIKTESELLKKEVEKAENKHLNCERKEKLVDSGIRLKFVEIKTEQELIKES